MNRIEIESALNKDRAWLIETYAEMSEEELLKPATPSEHDKATMWNAKDHLVHLALIEFNFAKMIRRHLEGDPNPVALRTDASGRERPMEEIMAGVHAWTEDWMLKQQGKSLNECIQVGQEARAESFKLLGELSDAQLAEKLPGAPWADGTIGGVISANAGHGRMHYQWVKDGWAAR